MKTNSASKSNEIPGWWLSSRACALLLTAGGNLYIPAAALAQFPTRPSTPEVGESDVAPTDLNKAATGFDRSLVVGFAIPETERS